MKGGRLSRPKHCSKGAQPVLKTVYRSSCRDKHNCQRRDSNLGPLTPQSDALTTRLLRPASIVKIYTDGVRSFVPGRPCSSRVQGRRRRQGGGGGDFEVELEKSQLNDVVGVADEPVEDAGDVCRVDAREVGRVESGRLRTRRAVLVRNPVALCSPRVHRNSNTHTHPFNGPFPGLPGSAGTRKVKPIWILLKQETVSGSGISWTIRKSTHRSRQITTPAPHHSVFYRPDALPAAQLTVSKH